VFFPGSTIGNFEPAQAVEFLRNAASISGAGGGLLIGVDLRKDKFTLERAYNDAAGVTAAFNLNLLKHVNRLCDADFDVAAFTHRAIYDEARGRIEMHLVSRGEQEITLARSTARPLIIPFAADELIVTEYSYKYDIAGFQALARKAGFAPALVWTDPHQRFSVHAFDSV
jgi:dimethylhistidine N-methyltransferase